MENLNELVVELDYQSHFSYEKRTELFNKYGISTSQCFFNPIMELATFATEMSTYKYRSNLRIGGYSHSGAVASSFNESFKNGDKKNDYVKIYPNGIHIYKYNRVKQTFEALVSFMNNKTVQIKQMPSYSLVIERDFYDKIDEWLIDFGYEKW